MRQSHLFTKTKKEVPSEEVSKNAQLLIRGGFVYKEMAGVYAFLPLGLRVLNKIIGIIREEMNGIGGQEITLTALQQKEIWEKTGRWSDDVVDNWFKTSLKNETELALGFTHEEPLTHTMKDFISSYRDLPTYPYQFQTKFRNETRAKSGIMRTREFIMKDLYSFSKNKEEHDVFYQQITEAYIRVFNRVGLGHKTYLTFASGGVFSKYSHEFQTITDAGEDIIYVDEEKGIAINKEVYTDEVLENLSLSKDQLVEKKATEVGNIFTLGTRFSEPFDLTYTDEKGEQQLVFMGSYGIGPARIMGTVIEVLSDNKGIVWPAEIAPFQVHIVGLGEHIPEEAEMLYKTLISMNIEVLFDDRRGVMPGEKFADADLIGIPLRVVVSARSIENGGFEVKKRTDQEAQVMSMETLLSYMQE